MCEMDAFHYSFYRFSVSFTLYHILHAHKGRERHYEGLGYRGRGVYRQPCC